MALKSPDLIRSTLPIYWFSSIPYVPLLAKWRHHELSYYLLWACIYLSLVYVPWLWEPYKGLRLVNFIIDVCIPMKISRSQLINCFARYDYKLILLWHKNFHTMSPFINTLLFYINIVCELLQITHLPASMSWLAK